MSAAADIAMVRAARPLVVELARVLSLAAHVDVAFVRALRTALFAESDVSTEADLWSSPLIQARSEGELVLRADVREALWGELRADLDALRAAWDAVVAVRTDECPLLQLEERLTFHGLCRELVEVDRELRKVIAAMRDEPDRRRNLAAWSAQAIAQLPAEVRETEAARILGNVARSWVATPIDVAAMTPAVDSMELVQALQPDSGARVSIYLRRLGDTLEVGTAALPPCVELPDVPASNPVLFVDHDTQWRLDLRGITKIPVRGDRVMLGTADKRRWWLEPEQAAPNLDAIQTVTGKDGAAHAMYLVAPDRVVTSGRWLAGSPTSFVSFGNRTQVAVVIAVDEDADIGLLRLSEPVSEPPLEIDPDVKQGQSWQAFPSTGRIVGTIATAWPGVTIRLPVDVTTPLPPGTPIFSGSKVIGHVGTEPARAGVLHTTSARLIRWWLGQAVTAAKSPRARGEEGADTAAASENAVATPQPVRVWVQSTRSIEVPREMTFQGAANVSKDDLVVMFVGEGERRWPAAVYRVAGGRRMAQEAAQYTVEPTSTEIRGELIVELPRPPEEILLASQREIASYADVTSQRDTRNLGIHDRLIDLLWRLQSIEPNQDRAEVRDKLRQLFGPPAAEVVATLPVVIELPDRISTGGLLGTTLAYDGDVRRFRRHRWGQHDVSLVTGASPPPDPKAIRIKVNDVELDPRSAVMEFGARLFRNPGKQAFYDACGTAPTWSMTEVIRGPGRGGVPGDYDLELIVNRVPKVSPAHAYRRGVQFVIAALDAMEYPGVSRAIGVLRVPGFGSLDLAEAQRVRQAGDGDGPVITWIDPETDLVELRFTEGSNLRPGFEQQIAAALGSQAEVVFPRRAPSDVLAHRFGVARERGGRRIAVADGEPARVSVDATDGVPVLGYVAFYTTTAEGGIDVIRVRAADGVAGCELSRRDTGYAVGAVIEDEGMILEHFIEPRDIVAAPKASYESPAFMR